MLRFGPLMQGLYIRADDRAKRMTVSVTAAEASAFS